MSPFIELLKNEDDFASLNGASLEQISAAEIQLGLSFSEEYKLYLKEYGIASANGHEFTGLCESPRLNVVTVTKAARWDNPSVPENYYVVEKAGIDGIMYWQEHDGTMIMTKPHCAVVKVGNSLAEFFSES